MSQKTLCECNQGRLPCTCKAAFPTQDWLLVTHPDGHEWVVRAGSKEHDRAVRTHHLHIAALLPETAMGTTTQAALDVLTERQRQIRGEGRTLAQDDHYQGGQLARAAACYALAGSATPTDQSAALLVSLTWPWESTWWKPTTSRRDLIKAGALILAEIERIDRSAPTGVAALEIKP
ncbi:hypothetical protein [Pseudomonas protegens]|uniref:hypothetical protein n=1 Tax=Pseudomonas protegens TaxID=380021 RepID=UPI001486DCDE|nr:hypothetical protein [Pseudomonas protegens]